MGNHAKGKQGLGDDSIYDKFFSALFVALDRLEELDPTTRNFNQRSELGSNMANHRSSRAH